MFEQTQMLLFKVEYITKWLENINFIKHVNQKVGRSISNFNVRLQGAFIPILSKKISENLLHKSQISVEYKKEINSIQRVSDLC